MTDPIKVMRDYVDNNNYVLKISKDRSGNQSLDVKRKGVITFLAKLFQIHSYKTSTVTSFIKDHVPELQGLDPDLFQRFCTKMHNAAPKNKEITDLFNQALSKKTAEQFKADFEKVMRDPHGMGKHMSEEQIIEVLKIYDAAAKSSDFVATFKAKINDSNHWLPTKGEHIIKNFEDLYKKSPPIIKKSDQDLKAQITQIARGDDFVAFYKDGITQNFGNFAVCPNGVKVFGETFKCSVGAFQWRKYQLAGIPEHELKGFISADGEEAFRIRNDIEKKYAHLVGPGTPASTQWSNGARDAVGGARDGAMWEILQAKFRDNPEFMQQLKATENAYLLEHKPICRWG